MTGFLTKEEIENWTAEDEFIFNFHLLLTSHPYFDKRTPEGIKELDKKMRTLLAEFHTNKSLPLEQQVIPKIAIEQLLEIIKDESEKANIRKYTCVNNVGYSQFERNIARRILDQLISNFSE